MDTATVNNKESEIERFEAYIKLDPKNTMLWTNLGDLYHEVGRFDESIACYEKCLMADEGNMIARSRLSNVLITQHRFEEAENIIRGIIKQNGEDNALLHNLGLTLYYQDKFADAKKMFEKARAAGMRTPKNMAYIVYSLHKDDDTAGALEMAKTWLKESPGPETEGYLSIVELDHGDMDAAKARAQHVLAQQANNPDANFVMGTWNLEQKDITSAMESFEQVIETEPHNPLGWEGIGISHLYQQNFPKAIESFQNAIDALPKNASSHMMLGWTLLSNKDEVGAEKAFRDAINADPSFGEAHGGLASALVMQNRLDEARTETKKALSLDGEGFGAVFAQSVSMQLRGKGNQGGKLLGKLLERQTSPRLKPLIAHIQDYASTATQTSEQSPPGANLPK